MKVKHKIIIIAIANAMLLISITLYLFYYTYFGYINKSKVEELKKNFRYIEYIINDQEDNMKSAINDLAIWDDTYTFIKDKDEEYISKNFQDNTLPSQHLNMVIFLNNKGEEVFSKSDSLEKDEIDKINQKLLIGNNGLYKIDKTSDIYNAKAGMILVNDKVFLVSEAPVIDSKGLLPSDGYIILVREIDKRILDYIYNLTNISLRFKAVKLEDNKNGNIIFGSHNKYISANKTEKDLFDNASICFYCDEADTTYSNRIYYFRIFLMMFFISTLVLGLLTLIIINKHILKRLSVLINFFNEIGRTKDTTLTIDLCGKDDFSELANATNNMLLQLNSAEKDLRKMNERYTIIMDATKEGLIDFNVKSKKLYINEEWKEKIRYQGGDGDEQIQYFVSQIHPEDYENIKEKYKEIIVGKSDYLQMEYRLIIDENSIRWVLLRGKAAERDEEGNTIRIVCTLSDITERKNYEEEILFLSYSDKLTGLRNRAYMEKQFDELDEDENSKYFIIMGDINGLKLMNDTFGHKEGDKLISSVSNTIKEKCEQDDVISRWGGDEFIILVKNKEESYVSNLIDNIKEAGRTVADYKFKISISLGYAKKDENHIKTQAVMKIAEERMYRNKLIESESSRNAIICSLLKTLNEKHTETEQHTMRIQYLSSELGKRIGLVKSELDELELVALLHDIGKIGIPEQILKKPDKLTAEEWDVMKTHSEIGYRIAKSTPELAHIAEEILAHHEKYDGTGYPNGLKGEEIPKLSRIINIVDSFDAMTHKRVYRDASSIEYAINELKRCSGKQFDPYLAEEFLHVLEDDIFKEYD